MKTQINSSSVNVWLSANDTYNWAHRPGYSWPCSQLSGNRVFASFDRNGLCDLAINGKDGDCDSHELSSCIADHLANKLPQDHPCFDVVVGQFSR